MELQPVLCEVNACQRLGIAVFAECSRRMTEFGDHGAQRVSKSGRDGQLTPNRRVLRELQHGQPSPLGHSHRCRVSAESRLDGTERASINYLLLSSLVACKATDEAAPRRLHALRFAMHIERSHDAPDAIGEQRKRPGLRRLACAA